MAELIDIMVFILSKTNSLSNARLTKLIYLSDWLEAIKFGHQVSNIKWYFNDYGPYVWDILDTARNHPNIFEVLSVKNMNIIRLKGSDNSNSLTEEESQALDYVINQTKDLAFEDFIQLVYSTYPIQVSNRYNYMDVVSLSRQYLKSKESVT